MNTTIKIDTHTDHHGEHGTIRIERDDGHTITATWTVTTRKDKGFNLVTYDIPGLTNGNASKIASTACHLYWTGTTNLNWNDLLEKSK